MGESVSYENLLRHWDFISLANWTEATSKINGALICSVNFYSSEVAFYLHKSIRWSCIEWNLCPG